MSAPVRTPDATSPHLTVPNHLRPSISRHTSGSSVRSTHSSMSHRPHPQHREFVPSTAGMGAIIGGEGGVDNTLAERWMFDEAEAEAEAEDERGNNTVDDPSNAEDEEESHEDEWERMVRDGSTTRRPAWRRPSPRWVYGFITGATLCMGMGMAPRSELYINLACLAHPPQQPSSSNGMALHNAWHEDPTAWQGISAIGTGAGVGEMNVTYPAMPETRSPADQWFIKLQHDMYKYKLSHQVIPTDPPSSPPSPAPSQAVPSAPLPHPTMPKEGNQQPVNAPNGGAPKDKSPEDRPAPGRGEMEDKVPYHEIDPSLCKKDPRVQAAAAKLTMGEPMSSLPE